MSSQTAPSNPTVDPYQILQIALNADGTITRHREIPNTPPTPDPSHSTPVLSKDIPLNQSNNTWVRIFLHREALDHNSSPKLPLIVYFHGGGFIISSAASSIFHDFCANMATDLHVIIVSVEYRLAPEHRLPAAYDDAMEALHWIKTTPDGLRASVETDKLEPLVIRGLILHQPFFGGSQRTQPELRDNDPILPLSVFDLMWELSLPIADRDHEFCNPKVGDGPQFLEKIKPLGWKVLVVGCDGDILFEHQIELVKLMREKGVSVVSQFGEGGSHGVDMFEPAKTKALHVVLKNFILSSLVA
ncbi:hypothetical protein ACJW30_10G157900 [Castanea mollissima]